MADFDINSFIEGQYEEFESLNEDISKEEDLLMEQILNNINVTPLGQVLKKIASLPELSKEKVLDVRHQLNEGLYDINDRLEVALDKVLEELTT